MQTSTGKPPKKQPHPVASMGGGEKEAGITSKSMKKEFEYKIHRADDDLFNGQPKNHKKPTPKHRSEEKQQQLITIKRDLIGEHLLLGGRGQ